MCLLSARIFSDKSTNGYHSVAVGVGFRFRVRDSVQGRFTGSFFFPSMPFLTAGAARVHTTSAFLVFYTFMFLDANLVLFVVVL